MAVIKPFKGIRYNQEKIADLSKVITPPYDVIDTESQDAYYCRHPNNIIRLEYGKIYAGDNNKNNRYTRAAADFALWLKRKILVQDNQPALYFYEQEFTFNDGQVQKRAARRGFIAAVKLEEYEKGIILPHEDTIPGHKTDRLALMRTCKASFSPIFGLYADPEEKIDNLFKKTIAAAGTVNNTDINITDEWGQVHRLWVVKESETIEKVQEVMRDKRIFIADGHHRYETALNYRNEKRSREKKNKTANNISTPYECTLSKYDLNKRTPNEHILNECASYEYTMMTLVNLYSPGLVILPAHRMVKNIKIINEDLPGLLKEDFKVQKYPLSTDKNNIKSFINLLKRNQIKKRHAFGLYLGQNRLYLLKLKESISLSTVMPKEKSPSWQNLDVSILHTIILGKYLGINRKESTGEDKLMYTTKAEEALKAVDRGDCQLAFLLNPTLVDEVTKIAASGEKMPQKSTYFYPKLITGLVIYSL